MLVVACLVFPSSVASAKELFKDKMLLTEHMKPFLPGQAFVQGGDDKNLHAVKAECDITTAPLRIA